jgi:hypothetical protein
MVSFTSVATVALAASASAVAATSEATPVYKFGTPTFFGSGCPKNSVAVIPSTDGQSVSVLFSDYNAQTSQTLNRDRKSCNLAVPVDIKPGISIGIFRVDYRGNAYVPKARGASAQFDAEYYFAGQKGPVVTREYPAGFNDNIFITNQIPVSAIVWSPCGASTNFRINSAVTALKNTARDGDEVQIAIDSVDATVENGFRYYITTRKC